MNWANGQIAMKALHRGCIRRGTRATRGNGARRQWIDQAAPNELGISPQIPPPRLARGVVFCGHARCLDTHDIRDFNLGVSLVRYRVRRKGHTPTPRGQQFIDGVTESAFGACEPVRGARDTFRPDIRTSTFSPGAVIPVPGAVIPVQADGENGSSSAGIDGGGAGAAIGLTDRTPRSLSTPDAIVEVDTGAERQLNNAGNTRTCLPPSANMMYPQVRSRTARVATDDGLERPQRVQAKRRRSNIHVRKCDSLVLATYYLHSELDVDSARIWCVLSTEGRIAVEGASLPANRGNISVFEVQNTQHLKRTRLQRRRTYPASTPENWRSKNEFEPGTARSTFNVPVPNSRFAGTVRAVRPSLSSVVGFIGTLELDAPQFVKAPAAPATETPGIAGEVDEMNALPRDGAVPRCRLAEQSRGSSRRQRAHIPTSNLETARRAGRTHAAGRGRRNRKTAVQMEEGVFSGYTRARRLTARGYTLRGGKAWKRHSGCFRGGDRFEARRYGAFELEGRLGRALKRTGAFDAFDKFGDVAVARRDRALRADARGVDGSRRGRGGARDGGSGGVLRGMKGRCVLALGYDSVEDIGTGRAWGSVLMGGRKDWSSVPHLAAVGLVCLPRGARGLDPPVATRDVAAVEEGAFGGSKTAGVAGGEVQMTTASRNDAEGEGEDSQQQLAYPGVDRPARRLMTARRTPLSARRSRCECLRLIRRIDKPRLQIRALLARRRAFECDGPGLVYITSRVPYCKWNAYIQGHIQTSEFLDALEVKVGHTRDMARRQRAYRVCAKGIAIRWHVAFRTRKRILSEAIAHLLLRDMGTVPSVVSCPGCRVSHREYDPFRSVGSLDAFEGVVRQAIRKTGQLMAPKSGFEFPTDITKPHHCRFLLSSSV
ncbi:hypothetical protein B0H11DRAFT_1915015 [Mycena galericulata]|nr:hypothetical protein B0H11DRAFT_1915015 [Mycena galericulata]